ncbi:hypothetical protein [Tenuifilum osseticum]|jgi:hypothetical protein|uniref:hypothetical protein n=1 Tax=Tenuifilum osseticum TaxID=3374723 RepID=UPI0034E4C2BB
MKLNDYSSHSEILRQVGFESRTLLNGITGPIQLIRSLSNDPNLLEILHILELSTVRFEKFSLRSQLLSDLLNPSMQASNERFELVDLLKHAVLELNDFIGFFGVNIELSKDLSSFEVEADRDIIYQSVLIAFEQFMSVLESGSAIKVSGEERSQKISISAFDNGYVADKFTQFSDNQSVEIDIALCVHSFRKFSIPFSVYKKNGHTVMEIYGQQ